MHPDQRYIEALEQNNRPLLQELYDRYFPKIRSWVFKNNGNEQDAADLFQEALIDIWRKSRNGFQLSCPFEAFVFLVCRNRWINHLNRNKTINVTFSDEEGFSNIMGEDSFACAEQVCLLQNRRVLIADKLAELGTGCQELLQKNWDGEKLEQIAIRMNTTYAYIRKKKSECMSKLTSLIKNSTQYSSLVNMY